MIVNEVHHLPQKIYSRTLTIFNNSVNQHSSQTFRYWYNNLYMLRSLRKTNVIFTPLPILPFNTTTYNINYQHHYHGKPCWGLLYRIPSGKFFYKNNKLFTIYTTFKHPPQLIAPLAHSPTTTTTIPYTHLLIASTLTNFHAWIHFLFSTNSSTSFTFNSPPLLYYYTTHTHIDRHYLNEPSCWDPWYRWPSGKFRRLNGTEGSSLLLDWGRARSPRMRMSRPVGRWKVRSRFRNQVCICWWGK